jgi:ABC-type Na+ transport system ATPase subunit NatA
MVCNKVVIINRGRVVIESLLNQLTREKDLEQIFLESVSREDELEVRRDIDLAS